MFNVVDVAIGVRETLARFSWRWTRIHEANGVDWAVAVVDVTQAEAQRAAINDRGHSVHLMAAEKKRLDSSATNTVEIDRFDLLGRPIWPKVLIVGDGEAEGILELVSYDSWLFCVSVDAWEEQLQEIS